MVGGQPQLELGRKFEPFAMQKSCGNFVLSGHLLNQAFGQACPVVGLHRRYEPDAPERGDVVRDLPVRVDQQRNHRQLPGVGMQNPHDGRQESAFAVGALPVQQK